MPRELTYAPRARDDVAAIRGWLNQPGSGPVAWRKMDAILTAIDDLVEHPTRFPLDPYPGVRERPCAGYRVLYRVIPDTGRDDTSGNVRVLRVTGPGQDRRRLHA